jgi:hypothetical protein
MAVERDHHTATTQTRRLISHLGNDRLMPAMDTVICANGDHRALAVGGRRIGFMNDEHEVLRYRFGQND